MGLTSLRPEGAARADGAGWVLRFGLFARPSVLPDQIPVPPLPARNSPSRGWFAFAAAEAATGTGQAPQRGGAQHRKVLWPDLDFTGHGHRKAAKPRGGAGGWDDMPGGGVPIEPSDPSGDIPGGNQGGGTETTGPGQDPIGAPEAISPVPLPAAGWLLAAAVGGLALARRRKAG